MQNFRLEWLYYFYYWGTSNTKNVLSSLVLGRSTAQWHLPSAMSGAWDVRSLACENLGASSVPVLILGRITAVALAFANSDLDCGG